LASNKKPIKQVHNHAEKTHPQPQPNKPQTQTNPKTNPKKQPPSQLVHTKHYNNNQNKKHKKTKVSKPKINWINFCNFKCCSSSLESTVPLKEMGYNPRQTLTVN
jgi:hypothetical protein